MTPVDRADPVSEISPYLKLLGRIFDVFSKKGRAGSVAEISVSGLEILPYEHFSPVTGTKEREELWRSG